MHVSSGEPEMYSSGKMPIRIPLHVSSGEPGMYSSGNRLKVDEARDIQRDGARTLSFHLMSHMYMQEWLHIQGSH